MPLVDKVVKVESAPLELLEHIAKVVKAVKASGGFEPSAIPAEVGALVAELPGVVASCGQLGGDYAENKVAFIKGGAIGLEELAEAVLA